MLSHSSNSLCSRSERNQDSVSLTRAEINDFTVLEIEIDQCKNWFYLPKDTRAVYRFCTRLPRSQPPLDINFMF